MATTRRQFLPSTHNISYNGVRFTAAMKVNYSGRAVYDPSGRVVERIEWTIAVEDIIAHSDKFDDTGLVSIANPKYPDGRAVRLDEGHTDEASGQPRGLSRIRDALMSPNGTLVIRRGCFGIGIDTGLVYPLHGVKPELSVLSPLPGGHAARVSWSAKFSTAPCKEWHDSAPKNTIRYFSYQCGFEFEDGLMTRTVEIEVGTAANVTMQIVAGKPKFTQEGRALAALPLLKVTIPDGFRRRRQTLRENAAKDVLTAVVVDEQLQTDSPFPDYVMHMDFEQSFANELPGAFARWSGDMSATVTLAPGVHGAYAAKAFFIVSRPRLVAMILNQPAGAQLIPMRFRATDNPFSRTWNFGFQYTYSGSLREIFLKSGFWKNTTEASADAADAASRPSWAAWHVSVDAAHKIGGVSGLAADGASLKDIRTLCTLPPDDADVTAGSVNRIPQVPWNSNTDAAFPTERPSVQHSWMFYDQSVVTDSDYGAVAGRPMSGPPSAGGVAPIDPDRNLLNPQHTQYGQRDDSNGAATNLQRMTVPVLRVSLRGQALRFGWPIAQPDFRSYGGATLEPSSVRFSHKIVGHANAIPIYLAQWQASFMALKVPQGSDIALSLLHVPEPA